MAFCDNLPPNQQLDLSDTKFRCLWPKALPKDKGELLLPWACLEDEVFPCYTVQLNVFGVLGVRNKEV